MNKLITETVIIHGQEKPVDQLKENSNIKVTVECKHGQRQVRWCRRHQLCRKCVAEAGIYNTSKKGRNITWGDKISKAKKGIKFSEEHKKALIDARIEKICKKKNISKSQFDGFPTKGEQFKLRNLLMNSINKNITKYSIKEQDELFLYHLGYSIQQLKKHLESQFQEGMSWDNYGEWHIDHIKPDSWFSYQTLEDESFKECWSLNNLQPMWGWQNIDKSNKYQGKYRPRRFYMLAGQFGSGKTTMCEQLKDKFTVINYDSINIKQLDSIIANNYFNDKPIIIDIPTNISTIYNRYKDKYEITMLLILENPEIIKSRILSRNGKVNIDNINKRYSRMLSISKLYADYSGTYEEVLSYINSLEI